MPVSAEGSAVSESTTIEGTTPAEVFAWLATPANHATNDESGHVIGPVGPENLTAKGDTFGMRMKWILPYRVTNTVVEFEPDERIAWRHFAGHRWRYELEAVDGGTRVTETFDLGRLPTASHAVYRLVFGFPEAYAANIRGSLERLRTQLST